MKRNQIAAILAATAAVLAGSAAFAAAPTNAEYYPFPEAMTAATVRTVSGTPVTDDSSGTDAKTMGAPKATGVDRNAEIQMYLKAGA